MSNNKLTTKRGKYTIDEERMNAIRRSKDQTCWIRSGAVTFVTIIIITLLEEVDASKNQEASEKYRKRIIFFFSKMFYLIRKGGLNKI